jgi:hypothetical protein
MSQFKAMKFWIGNDEKLSERVQQMLFSLGYAWSIGHRKVQFKEAVYLCTSSSGLLMYGSTREVFEATPSEPKVEINIDWLRSAQREVVTIGDQKYYKDDLENALKDIKSI